MKNLLFNLSNVSEFFKEKRFIYEEVQKPAPEAAKVEKMAKDTNDVVRAAREEGAKKARTAGILGNPEINAMFDKMAGKLDPKTLDKSAKAIDPKTGKVIAEDVGLAGHKENPTTTAMPTIEKKKWR